jgi:D-glycero-D-manno-heptose 1,7-bisphosphate phosphatase
LKTKAVFLDRDGVINQEKGYVHKIENFHFFPYTFRALRKIPKGYKKIIITNQSGISRGMYSRAEFEKLNSWMLSKIEENEIKVDKVYFCPHHPDEDCLCRKPKTGLIRQAQKEFALDLKNSWLIGDKTSDILTGKNAGCRTILVKTGFAGEDGLFEVKPDYKALNLEKAVELIVKKSQ